MTDFYTNISLKAIPVEDSHIIRLIDLKEYVTSRVKSPVRVVSVSNIEASYGNKILTADDNTVVLKIDGVTLAVNDRVLVAGQTNKIHNGIYVVTSITNSGVTPFSLTRAEDFNNSSDVYAGVKVYVTQGDKYFDKLFVLTSDGNLTLDTDELEFAAYAGLGSGGEQYSTEIVGDNTVSSYTITHSLDSFLVNVDVLDKNNNYANVLVDVTRPTVNTVLLNFDVTLQSTDEFVVVVRKIG
jgi:hypothetical protein